MTGGLLARPAGLLSWRYNVFEGPEKVASVFPHTLTGPGGLWIGPARFEVESPGLLSRATTLTFQGVAVARSDSEDVFRDLHRVDVSSDLIGPDAAPLAFRLISQLGSYRVVGIGPAGAEPEGGVIDRRGLFSRDATIDLPPSLPLAVRLYLFAIVLADWRRQSSS